LLLSAKREDRQALRLRLHDTPFCSIARCVIGSGVYR
jgi:hypothetical protein